MKNIIDISEHNGTIDFNKVKQDGIEGIILRVGWIGNKQNHTIDKKFDVYYKACSTLKIPIGVYVYSYCTSLETLKQGTNWVLEKLNYYTSNYKKAELPIFLDLEDNTIQGLGKTNLTNQALEFCKMIESKGYKAGVYASKSWFTNLIDVNKLITYKIWLAEWNGKQNHTANFNVDLWQYTSNGRVNRYKW